MMAQGAGPQGSCLAANSLLAELAGGEGHVVPSGVAMPLPSSALHPKHPGWALEAPKDAQGSLETAVFRLF